MTRLDPWRRVGELRPSQLLHTFGVGAMVDLPNISAMVLGLDDWTQIEGQEIAEERLLAAVRKVLGPQVAALRPPPPAPELGDHGDGIAQVGVPVAPFPRWLLCSYCRLLAPIRSGLFRFRGHQYRPDLIRFVHEQCRALRPQVALPARFVLACENGHLDDFPWLEYVHRGSRGCPGPLRLRERGLTGEASDVRVTCDACKAGRSMAEAFGERADGMLKECRGRRPHLRDFEERVCTEPSKTILLGASNSWFSLVMTALSIPQEVDPLGQLVEQHWNLFEEAEEIAELRGMRRAGALRAFGSHTDDEIWRAVQRHRAHGSASDQDEQLKPPEWRAFVEPDTAPRSDDFKLRSVAPPRAFPGQVKRVVLVERIREVKALVGFTRIQSVGDFDDTADVSEASLAPLARRSPRWVPAVEVHGEGVFLQLDDDVLRGWLAAGSSALAARRDAFERGHTQWRMRRGISARVQMPGLGYVLLHSFAHALMRQLAIECGYALASIRERIYFLPPEADHGPMAGLLLYTAAPDSEGTLGGLVSLGEPAELGRHLVASLERVRLCGSDPLCAEHRPDLDGVALHGAACHACLFVPETSCERGNRYLDRSLLVETLGSRHAPFFPNDLG